MVGVCHTILPLHLFGAEPILGYLTADISLVGCLAAFAAGHSRFGPEVQTGNFAFLDALPTSRHRVFLVKVSVGYLSTGLTALGLLVVKCTAMAWPERHSCHLRALAFLSGALMTAHYAVGSSSPGLERSAGRPS